MGFEIQQVCKDVFLIKELFCGDTVNLYLVKGKKHDLLIDTGNGVSDLKAFVDKLSKNVLVVNTHEHFDHIGGNFQFDRVAVHKSSEAILKNPDRISTALFIFREDFTIKPSKPTKLLSDGDILDLGDKKFRVIHTPGHSPDSICLYEEDLGLLFTGDTIYDGKLYFDLPTSNVSDYLNSLKRIKNLKVKIVFPGHNNILTPKEFSTLISSAIKLVQKQLNKKES